MSHPASRKLLPEVITSLQTEPPSVGHRDQERGRVGQRGAKKQLSLSRFVSLAALAVSSLFAIRQISTWPTRLRYPGEQHSIEGPQMAEMLHLRQGLPTYEPPSSNRFDAALYGPLYYLLGSRLLDPAKPAYLRLRLLSLLGMLLSLTGSAVLAYWITGARFAAALAPLTCLGCVVVTRSGLSSSRDCVGATLSFIGFLAAYRFRDSQRLLCAVPIMLLAFFYSQIFVAAPLAVLLYLLWEKRYRLAAEFACALAGGSLTTLAVIELVLFPRQAFLTHFLAYNTLPFRLPELSRGLTWFSVLFFIPTIGALSFLSAYRSKLLLTYSACASLIPLLAIAKAGSGANYFVEPALVLFTLLVCQISTCRRRPPSGAAWLVLLTLALQANHLLDPPAPRPEDNAKDAALQQFLRAHFGPGTVSAGYYSGDLVRAGLDTPITNLWHYTQLVRKGTIPDFAFLDRVEGERFGVILVNFDLLQNHDSMLTDFCLTAPFRAAILAHYKPIAAFPMPDAEKAAFNDGKSYIWVPNRSRQTDERLRTLGARPDP